MKEVRGLLSGENPAADARWTKDNENPQPGGNIRYFEIEEVDLVLRAARRIRAETPALRGRPRPNALWLETLLATGGRTYSEGGLISLSSIKKDLPENGMVPLVLQNTKVASAKGRTVWIPEDLAGRLAGYARWHEIGHNEPLFPWSKSTGKNFWAELRERLEDEGEDWIQEKTPYGLRHSFAIFALRGDPDRGKSGVNIQDVKELMGHRNLKTTEQYLKFCNKDKARGLAVSAQRLGLMSEEPDHQE